MNPELSLEQKVDLLAEQLQANTVAIEGVLRFFDSLKTHVQADDGRPASFCAMGQFFKQELEK